MKPICTKMSIVAAVIFFLAPITAISAENVKQNWERAATVATKNASYLSKTERQIINMVNRARVGPSAFAETYLSKAAKKDSETGKLYRAMKELQPMEPLFPSKSLCLAAKEYVREMYGEDVSQIQKKIKSEKWERIERYGEWKEHVAASFSLGYHDPLQVVVQLLLRARSPKQSNMLDPRNRFIGAAIGTNKKYRYMCVMNFVSSIADKSR